MKRWFLPAPGVFGVCLILAVISGCVSPRVKFSSARVNPAQFKPVDPLDDMIRRRSKLSISQVIDIIITKTHLDDLDANQADIISICTDLDASRNVVWKVDVQTRAAKANEGIYVAKWEVNDNTGTVRPREQEVNNHTGTVSSREQEAIELLKALEPHFKKDL